MEGIHSRKGLKDSRDPRNGHTQGTRGHGSPLRRRLFFCPFWTCSCSCLLSRHPHHPNASTALTTAHHRPLVRLQQRSPGLGANAGPTISGLKEPGLRGSGQYLSEAAADSKSLGRLESGSLSSPCRAGLASPDPQLLPFLDAFLWAEGRTPSSEPGSQKKHLIFVTRE